MIQVWGQPVGTDKMPVLFHIPHPEELDFARDFVETFIYAELNLLLQNDSKLSNEQRSRSLTMVQHLAMGCARVLPRIPNMPVTDL